MVTTLERSKDKSIICWIFEKSSLQPRLLLIPGVSSKPNTSILHCWSYGLECASQSVGNVTCSVIEIYLTSHHSLLVTSACLPCSASCHVMETLGQACGSSNEAPACGMLLRLVSLELSSRFASGRKNTHKPLVAAVPLSVFTPSKRAIVLLQYQHMRHANCLPPPLYLLSACGPAFGVSGWLQPTLSKSGSPSQRGSRPSPPTAPVTAPSTVFATTHTRTLFPPHATLPMSTT
jgi:hypothetical protein